MENLNHKYWATMTMKSTLPYCQEMLKLSSDPYEKVSESEFKQRCAEYVNKTIEYHKNKCLREHLDELYEISPFPEDIRGYLHEHSGERIFQPIHLMCKVATFRVQDITFEFLVEYGILEPEVEIYYGIKAISDHKDTTEEFAEKVIDLSREWFDYLGWENEENEVNGVNRVKRHRGKNPIDWKQHKFTNNVHDGTFWISWVRMESKEKMGDVIKNLDTSIFVNFRLFLKKKAEGKWKSIEKETSNFLQIKKNVNTKQFDIKKINKYPEKIKILDKACEFKDKNTEDGSPLLKKCGSGYRFSCNSDQARIFLEWLFNPIHFMNTHDYACEFWKIDEKKWKIDTKALERAKSSGRTKEKLFEKYVKERSAEGTKHWYSGDKTDIDRSWVRNTFLDKDYDLFNDSFFTSGIHFEDENKFLKIKETKSKI